MTILVAHPYPVVREGIAHALRTRLDLSDVVMADSTEAATRVAYGAELQGAVVDMDLLPDPEMALCELLREHDVPTVVVSRDDTDFLLLLGAGARGIVLPTDGMDELLIAVRTVLEGHAYVPTPLLGTVLKGLIVQRRAHPGPASLVSRLSPREREVLGLLGAGADHRQIAQRLVISPHTAKTHIQRLLGKLEVRSRAEAAALAAAHGLTAPDLEVRS